MIILRSLGRWLFPVAVLIVLVALPPPAQEPVTVSALVQSPDRYDGELVRVAGGVADYQERISHPGGPDTIFHLREGRASGVVFAWPHLGFRNGLRVRVTGTFIKVKTYSFVKAQRTVVVR